MKKLIVLIPVFVLTAAGVFAQDRTPRVNTRQATQQARIAEGRASGELTRGETRGLRAEQRHIRRSERRAKADGNVTPRERRRLDRQQNRSSRDIRRAKHNALEPH